MKNKHPILKAFMIVLVSAGSMAASPEIKPAVKKEEKKLVIAPVPPIAQAKKVEPKKEVPKHKPVKEERKFVVVKSQPLKADEKKRLFKTPPLLGKGVKVATANADGYFPKRAKGHKLKTIPSNCFCDSKGKIAAKGCEDISCVRSY